jgi:DNA-binding SARP family transcriptional activator/TolB-like protein/lipoprotein NlpI
MIEFRMLGTVDLTGAGQQDLHGLLGQTRRLALLAYLAAARPRGPHRRDRLLAMFWPELDQEHARGALRQALHVLRAGLGRGALATPGEDVVLLDRGAVWSDVAAFDEAIAARHEQDALDLYRGDFLDAFFISGAPDFEEWVESERSRLQEAAANAARTMVERLEAAGDLTAALDWARRAVRLAPLDEDLARRLMSLLDRLGDAPGALRVYDALGKRTAADLDSSPDARTRALAAAITGRCRSVSDERETSKPTSNPIPTATSNATSTATAGQTSTAARRRWRLALAAVAFVAISAVLVSGWRLRVRAGLPQIESIVVLPLQDLSGGMAELVTEGLTTDIGRIRGLRVISRRSADAFRASAKAPSEIGRELQVDAFLEGSVQRQGDGIRIDVRLVRATTGDQIWAGRFEGAGRDGFALEDDVSRGVRAALGLPAATEPRAHQRSGASAEAHDLYLLGKIRVRRENEADNAAAISLLERAVALDPEFAAAQAALSYAYGLRVSQFAPDDNVALARAENAAQKAQQLDPELAEAHYAAGQLFWGVLPGRWSHRRAAAEFKRAIALNSNLAEAHHYLGLIYLHAGLLDQAESELQATLSLEPSDDNARRRIGIAHVYRGRYEEGLRTFRQVPPLANQSLWNYQVAWALLYLERDAEARALMDGYLRAHPEDRGGVVTSTRAIWFAKAGDERRAEEDIQTAVEKGKGFIHFHHTAYNIASAYALLGQPGRALQWLREAAETGWPCYPYFANDPNLTRIRTDPAYVTFMRELKATWESYQRDP